MATVLIIDDDPVSRTILRNILQNLGYTTFEAKDGRAGTNIYRANLPDIVLLDLIMPERDGFETLFDLRNINREAKIIIVTGGGRMTIDLYQQLTRSLRLPELLLKPFSAEAVAMAVTNLLNHRELDAVKPLQEEP